MNAYQHILAMMLMLSQDRGEKKGLTLEQNLQMLREMGAYWTYPDNISFLLRVTPGVNKAFQEPSHFKDNAHMTYIIGDELRNATQYPEGKFYIPEDKLHIPDGEFVPPKISDGRINLGEALEYNKATFESPEGIYIWLHLLQDDRVDRLFQETMATCNIDSNHGKLTKSGMAKFNQTGKKVLMGKYITAVSQVKELITLTLFRRLRLVYPGITFDQIKEAASESYENHYPDAITERAKRNVVPEDIEQNRILHVFSSGGDTSYYDKLKRDLVESLGAFSSVKEIDKQVENLVDEITGIAVKKKENKTGKEHELE